MSKLLINENPLQVLPKLAEAIGLNEAIFLQQLHYWLTPDPVRNYEPHYLEWEGEECPWVYNTYESKTTRGGKETGWVANFPFWSARTIMRIVANLKELNLIITTDKYNTLPTDRTLWYTINYEELDRLEIATLSTSTMTDCQPQEGDNLADSREGQDGNLLPETPSEDSTETTSERGAAEKTPPPAPSHDPSFLPSVEEQLPTLFPNGVEDPDYEQAIQRSGWRINNTDHRRAMALFLEASQLDIPFDKSARTDWLKQIDIHVKTYGLDRLRDMYPRVVAEMNEDGLSICRPGSLTNPLAALKASDKRNGAPNARPSERLTDHQKRIAAAIRATARDPSG